MKKIIMLATYFPPAGGISTFRITKFVKFLPKFDCEPVVLTVNEMSYKESNFLIDTSLLKDVPKDLTIYRTNIGGKAFMLKGLLNGLPTRWLRPLFTTIGSIIKKEKPALLFATGDPFFPLLVAPFAKRFYGLKYVIDLRDPWKLAVIDNPLKGIKGKIFGPLNNFLEPIVLNGASKVIVVSEKMAQDYRVAYPKRLPEDFIVIPNGYDPDDYDPIVPKKFDDFTIVYAGKFLSGKSFRNPSYFLKAIKILKERGINVVFKYVGELNEEVSKIAEEAGVIDHFEGVGYMSYLDTIAHMKGSDLLLLIGSGQETEQTGKIFDYLGSKRPILALAAKKGGIADVVNGIDQITLIENKEPEKIADAIEMIYTKRSNKPVERTNISKYLRESLTSELVKVFENVIENTGKSRPEEVTNN
ncbi:glycosyltransferase family 4 protein [Pedobacter polaris]|uniref:Glycosyltransferase family 4 protein n=1 Tax=Pedobacter polaris TaxID=2571273 RepID=A0A4U1CZ81_9SPHI|nr:glycosyltransferase [Pedobacter polaris]TKC13069.1 glycosyltransferase family 4 protein [Pedobacter polaris]